MEATSPACAGLDLPGWFAGTSAPRDPDAWLLGVMASRGSVCTPGQHPEDNRLSSSPGSATGCTSVLGQGAGLPGGWRWRSSGAFPVASPLKELSCPERLSQKPSTHPVCEVTSWWVKGAELEPRDASEGLAVPKPKTWLKC